VIVEEVTAVEIAEDVVGLDVEPLVVVPGVWVADANVEGVEFFLRFGFGLLIHPCQSVDALAEGSDDIGDHFLCFGLGLRREIFLRVDLADFVTDESVDDAYSAAPARTLLRGSGQGLTKEIEAFIDECLGEDARLFLDLVIGEIVLPGIDRCRFDESRLAFEGRWLPDDEARLFGESGGGEVFLPIESGSLYGEVGGLPGIVGVMNVFAVFEAYLDGGDGLLECDDTGGAGIRITVSGGLEHCTDVLLIFLADLFHVRRIGEIVVTIREHDSALKKISGVVFGIVEVRCDPKSENIRRVVVGVVEGIDICAELLAERVRERLLIVDGIDGIEMRLDGRESGLLDCGFIHVGVVEIGDHARTAAGGSALFGGFFDDLRGALAGDLIEFGEYSDGAAIGGNLGALEPIAVGVMEEIVAGFDRLVDGGDIDAMNAGGWCGVGRLVRGLSVESGRQ